MVLVRGEQLIFELEGREILEGGSGVLAAAIAVVNEAVELAAARDGLIEGIQGQCGRQVFPTVVGDAAARTGIQSEGQIKPALAGGDAGKITLPDLAGAIRGRHLGQPMG